MIKRLLIANRGEIACRIAKTAHLMGIESIAVYSDQDKNSLHVKCSDEAYYIGPSPPSQSYLNQDKIIEIAKAGNICAIHPGYGFLSENYAFAEKCEKNGINFIGPPSKAIHDMGIKSLSKQLMTKANVPIIPGYFGENQSDSFLLQEARTIGYPVMLKADYGGGGKGIRICYGEEEFLQNLDRARNEAQKSFGNQKLMVEKYIEDPKHIEVQIFGDKHGSYVTLFERDCSIQRRHQKVIEETPANFLNQEIREKIYDLAIKAASSVDYVGAGTVEFIMDKEGNFYFMEMNTRLQVEHGITEMITGLDLVEWQLRVAQGEVLPQSQNNIKCEGHAIEARICAEDTDNNFIPSPGKLEVFAFAPKEWEGIRFDSGVKQGDEISIYYDSMIAKVMAWGPNRTLATSRLKDAVNSLFIIGLKTNVGLVSNIVCQPDFNNPRLLHTNYIKSYPKVFEKHPTSEDIFSQVTIAKLLDETKSYAISEQIKTPFRSYKWFRVNQHFNQELIIKYGILEKKVEAKIINSRTFEVNGVKISVHDFNNKLNPKSLIWNNDSLSTKEISYVTHKDDITLKSKGLLHQFNFATQGVEKKENKFKQENVYASPINGTIEKIFVKKGDSVKKDQPLIVLLAMKMEYVIKAAIQGKVDQIHCKEGENVQKSKILITLI